MRFNNKHEKIIGAARHFRRAGAFKATFKTMQIKFTRGILWLTLTTALFMTGTTATARVTPNHLFADGAVLQRDQEIPVWGTAAEGEKITVQFLDQKVSAVARDGRWMIRLKPVKAGGPFTMTITGENTVEIRDILVGEVWLCSGQSNMAFQLCRAANAPQAIESAADPALRFFQVPHEAVDQPRTDIRATWKASTSVTASNFSAVAYFFGRDLRKALGVPVGLIEASVGGTPAEAWTPRQTLESDPQLTPILDRHQDALHEFERTEATAKKLRVKMTMKDPAKSAKRPGGLYNAMIAPLEPYAISGVIWYQGEANATRATEYRDLFPAMIQSWRKAWGQGEFPFLFVQIAPFKRMNPEIRDAQLWSSQYVPRTAMVVTTDVGDAADIHPKRKEPVGSRLALAARALAEGEKIEYSGPVFASARFEGSKAVLSFEHVDGGLVALGGELKGFEIAGKDGVFSPATATIESDQIVASSPAVAQPAAVRYGWANVPDVNLFNKAGLPASPFRVKKQATSR